MFGGMLKISIAIEFLSKYHVKEVIFIVYIMGRWIFKDGG